MISHESSGPFSSLTWGINHFAVLRHDEVFLGMLSVVQVRVPKLEQLATPIFEDYSVGLGLVSYSSQS